MIKLRDLTRREGGFTLIELLIVIIILGILVAIVIFGVSTFRERSIRSACNTDEKQVKTAVAAWLTNHTSPPATMAELGPTGAKILEDVPPASEADAVADGQGYYISYTSSSGAAVGKIVVTGGADTDC